MRVATYNVRHCEGLDGRVDVERVAAVVRALEAEIVALQELDSGMERTGGVDQPAELARLTGLSVAFHPTRRIGGGLFGIAVASRVPLTTRFEFLPRPPGREPRGLIVAEHPRVTVLATHLSTHAAARPAQLARVAEVARGVAGPVVLLGDLNEGPGGLGSLEAAGLRAPPRTLRTLHRTLRHIDHVLAGGGAEVVALLTVDSDASDHRPVVAEVEVP